MLSAQYYVQENTNVYISYGSGFDTPTLNQIIYSPSYVNYGGTNLGNIGINAARTRQIEFGLRASSPAPPNSMSPYSTPTPPTIS